MAVASTTQKKKALKQVTYVWEGADRKGARKKGEINGSSIALVKADLRRQGISPLKVRKKPANILGGLTKKRIKTKDIAVFSRQLATMISAGVPLVQAFDIIGKSNDHPGMQKLLNAVKIDIEGGSSLSQALRKHPDQFDALFCNLVKAGEQAGILEGLLNKIATYKEKTEVLKSKIKKALVYPIGVLLVAFVVTFILLVWVVPQFETLFSSFGADLPVFTQVVIAISQFVQEWWLIIIGTLMASIYLFFVARKKSESFAAGVDRFLLRVPILGKILMKAAVARYSRTLGTMFAAGVPVVEAMESVAGATGNHVFSTAVLKMRDEIATGQQLQMAMSQSGLFPSMTVQMVAIGEESGSLDGMLNKVAEFYEQEVDDAVDNMSNLMEPAIMVVLGVLVGGLVLAMYMPIFQMGQIF